MSSSVAAAAGAAIAVRRLIVGGLIAVLDNDVFIRVANELRKRGAFVIHGLTGVFSKSHVYLLPYNGITFVTKSREPLPIAVDIEVESLEIGPISI